MKTKIISIVFTAILSSCASYTPVQYVGGKRGDYTHETCGYHFLPFNLSGDKATVYSAIEESGLSEDQIYSIDSRFSPFLIIYESCVIITGNSTVTRESALNSKKMRTIDREKKRVQFQKEAQKKCEDMPSSSYHEFRNVFSMEACDKFYRSTRGRCRRDVRARMKLAGCVE